MMKRTRLGRYIAVMGESWMQLAVLVCVVSQGQTLALLDGLDNRAESDSVSSQQIGQLDLDTLQKNPIATSSALERWRAKASGPVPRKRLTLSWGSQRQNVCPVGEDGLEQYLCPSQTRGSIQCVDQHQLCDGRGNCPSREDESAVICLFYRVLDAKLNMITRTLVSQ